MDLLLYHDNDSCNKSATISQLEPPLDSALRLRQLINLKLFDDDEEMKHEQLASTAPGRFHAARQYPHSSLALSGRVSGCEFQFQTSDAFRADA